MNQHANEQSRFTVLYAIVPMDCDVPRDVELTIANTSLPQCRGLWRGRKTPRSQYIAIVQAFDGERVNTQFRPFDDFDELMSALRSCMDIARAKKWVIALDLELSGAERAQAERVIRFMFGDSRLEAKP